MSCVSQYVMKRFLTILSVAFCILSCDKEPQNGGGNSGNIPGYIHKLVSGYWVEDYSQFGYSAKWEGIPQYTFREDGSWEYYNYDEIWMYHTDTYKYILDGNVITLIYDESESGRQSFEIVTINDKEMEWQRVGTDFSIDGIAGDYKCFYRTDKPTSEPGTDDDNSAQIPRDELDVPVVEGEFTGYVYKYGYCNEQNFWHQFEEYQQRIDMFQIPDEDMAKLTTEGLSQTCMYYPLRKDMLVYESSLMFINLHVTEWYNGLKELAARTHAPEALLKLYENMKLADPAIAEEEGPMYDNDINVPWTFMDRNYLEMLLASAHFTPKMTVSQLDRLSKAIEDKTKEIMQRNLNSYQYGFAYPYCVLCRILLVKHQRGLIDLTADEIEKISFYMLRNGSPRSPADYVIEVLRVTFGLLEEHFPEMDLYSL